MKTLFTLLFAAVTVLTANAQNNVVFTATNGTEISIDKNANGAVIRWQTLSEINSSQFEVEISYDNKNFESIRTVAASDITKWATNYEATFKRTFLSAEKVYYRIKTIFTDGAAVYTAPVTLEIKGSNGISYAGVH